MNSGARDDEQLFEVLAFDDRGLVPAIAQDVISGDVRMVAWMNRESIERTLETGKATFFSRSRGQLWTKGETSGHFLWVKEIYADCDGDTLLLRVLPEGPSCHTGKPTCFFRAVHGTSVREAAKPPPSFLFSLESEIEARRTQTAERSYTRTLLDGGAAKIGEKIVEEADELSRAIHSEDAGRVASEAADLVYHVMVGLQLRGVPWARVLGVLAERTRQSGHEEKASRP